MFKKKIVIASVLKPINDVRMYEKIAISLDSTEKYEIHIIGASAQIPDNKKIQFHPLGYIRRISLDRIKSYWKCAKIIHQVKPEAIIVTTHELLLVAIANKILFGTKVFYDVQENYFRNIWYQNNFLSWIKPILALTVRLKEKALVPFIDHLFLADAKYAEEMPFMAKNSTIILNKYKFNSDFPLHERAKEPEKIRFIYSGTISEVYGVLEAISFYKSIKKEKSCTLTIVGYCLNNQLFNAIKEIAESDADINLKISRNPVNHKEIVSEYLQSDYALAPYHPNKSLENCIPVKFYEHVAFKLPTIIPDHNPYWIAFLADYQAAIAIDFANFDPISTIKRLEESSFFNDINRENITWESEERKLLHILALKLA